MVSNSEKGASAFAVTAGSKSNHPKVATTIPKVAGTSYYWTLGSAINFLVVACILSFVPALAQIIHSEIQNDTVRQYEHDTHHIHTPGATCVQTKPTSTKELAFAAPPYIPAGRVGYVLCSRIVDTTVGLGACLLSHHIFEPLLVLGSRRAHGVRLCHFQAAELTKCCQFVAVEGFDKLLQIDRWCSSQGPKFALSPSILAHEKKSLRLLCPLLSPAVMCLGRCSVTSCGVIGLVARRRDKAWRGEVAPRWMCADLATRHCADYCYYNRNLVFHIVV